MQSRAAYQVTGDDNSVDLVFAPGTVSHLELGWDLAAPRRTIQRLSAFARLIRFDKAANLSIRRMMVVAQRNLTCEPSH